MSDIEIHSGRLASAGSLLLQVTKALMHAKLLLAQMQHKKHTEGNVCAHLQHVQLIVEHEDVIYPHRLRPI